jgi:hypothetical protein
VLGTSLLFDRYPQKPLGKGSAKYNYLVNENKKNSFYQLTVKTSAHVKRDVSAPQRLY